MSQGIYENHRENQREWILKVSQDLFIQNGIEKTSISAIAKAARLTRATLYNYFPSKEDIAHEIFKLITSRWEERNHAEVWNTTGTGFELIERFITSHINHLTENLEEARFGADFNHLYAKEWSVDVMKNLLTDVLEGERVRLLECIRNGQEDGSIRRDMDAYHILSTIFNFMSAITDRLGAFGTKIELEYDISLHTMMHNICRIFLDGLKPTQ